MESNDSPLTPQDDDVYGHTADVVVIDWKDLVAASKDGDGSRSSEDTVYPTSPAAYSQAKSSKLSDALRKSLGRDAGSGKCKESCNDDRCCIGLIAIRGVPGFVQAKAKLFSMAHSLVSLPPDVLEGELSDPTSLYNAGWSFGKEKLGTKPDTAKGSFYYNPVKDIPGTEQDRQAYPLSYPVNVWPAEEMLPGFRDAAKELGNILFAVVVALARQVDSLALSTLPDSYQRDLLHSHLNATDKVKARLLYYFPIAQDGPRSAAPKEDSWIAWHNDSGFFTALAGDWYVQHSTGERMDVSNTMSDPDAGLYVESRSGRVLKVNLPEDCVAVQLGECTQIVTGGAVRATPHCVRGSTIPNVARVSLAVFVDTVPAFPLVVPTGCDVRRDVLLQPAEDVAHGEMSRKKGRVPPIGERWTSPGMTFGDFLSATFQKYYEWTTATTTNAALSDSAIEDASGTVAASS